MAPYFIRNLIPRRESRAEGRPLLEVLQSLTLVQWGLFWSGYVHHSFASFTPHLARCAASFLALRSMLIDSLGLWVHFA